MTIKLNQKVPRYLLISLAAFTVVYLLLTLIPRLIKNVPEITSLDGEWQICNTSKATRYPFPDCKWITIVVPFKDADLGDERYSGKLLFRKSIAKSSIERPCSHSLCSIVFAEVGDSARIFWNGNQIHVHGALEPKIKYRKHLPLRFQIRPQDLSDSNELIVETASLKSAQLGIRGSPNGVYTLPAADSLERRLSLYSVGLPIFGSFECALIGLFLILFANSWNQTGAPMSIMYRTIFLAFVSSAYFFSFSELPREFATIETTGFAHFFLRLLFDYSLFEFVIGIFGLEKSKIYFVRYLYYACLSCFAGSFIVSSFLIDLGGFDMAHFLMKVFFPLLLLPVVIGIVYSVSQKAAVLNDFLIVVFFSLLPMEINDIMIFHGFLKSIYFVKFYPIFLTVAFTFYLLKLFKLHFALKIANEEKIQSAEQLMNLTAQVSHDIRSPLSALNFLLGQLDSIPEEKRILIRSSVNRINDISNELLSKGKKGTLSKKEYRSNLDSVMMASLVDSVVSEKRVSLREKSNIQIEAKLDQSYGLFSRINPIEMMRLISNAITNSVEALEFNTGHIEVTLESENGIILLKVKDDGKGIPPEVLNKIGVQGFSYGKTSSKSGNGLGVYHAKKTLESIGGSYSIQSKMGTGTTVEIKLKKDTPPDWFVQKISILKNQCIVAIDDDSSVLEIWKQRLQNFVKEYGVKLITCTSPVCLKDWISQNSVEARKAVYLMDYELLGQKQNGLDLIEELNLNQRAILVSSRYEEEDVKERCAELRVSMIPKGLASLVPINLKVEKQRFDGILIDDDEQIVHAFWKFGASQSGKSFLYFIDEDSFLNEKDKIDLETPIYIDLNLKNGVRGQDVACRIHELGFTNLHLATGYQADQIDKPEFVKTVIGKDFPC